jgi:signal peptidase II
MTRQNKYILFFVVLFLGIGLDQITKYIATQTLVGAGRIRIVGDLFAFTYAENDGAFLSLGSNWNPTVRLLVLTVIPGLLLVSLLLYMLFSDRVNKTEIWAFSLIAAGGIGNIIDRILAGRVVDFMHMDFWGITQTGVFNVADLYIMVGIGVYIVAYFRGQKSAKSLAENAE